MGAADCPGTTAGTGNGSIPENEAGGTSLVRAPGPDRKIRRRLYERLSLDLQRALPGFPATGPAGCGRPRGIVVGYSGGSDSTALLRLLVEFTERRRIPPGAVLTAAHLDHGLSPDSGERRRFCRKVARQLGVGWVEAKAEVAGRARRERRPLEEAGRLERLDFFARAAREQGFRVVAVGHTRSDQAETVLLRLTRGAGTLGLGAMPPARRDERGFLLIRPLLRIARAETRALVRAEGWPVREDASNRSRRFTRNRIRHEVLPLLRDTVNPQVEAALARAADLLRDDETALARLAATRFAELRRALPGSPAAAVRLPADALAAEGPALARRLVRLGLREIRGHLRRLGRRHVEAVRTLAETGSNGDRLDLPGVSVHLEGGLVVLSALSRGRAGPAAPAAGGTAGPTSRGTIQRPGEFSGG